MSARYRATDTYSQEYGNYLLSKYQYDVNYKNQQVQDRANMIQGIVNSIGSMGMMYLGNQIGQRMAYNMSTTLSRLTNDLNRMNSQIGQSTANTYNYSSNFKADGTPVMTSQDTRRGQTYDMLDNMKFDIRKQILELEEKAYLLHNLPVYIQGQLEL